MVLESDLWHPLPNILPSKTYFGMVVPIPSHHNLINNSHGCIPLEQFECAIIIIIKNLYWSHSCYSHWGNRLNNSVLVYSCTWKKVQVWTLQTAGGDLPVEWLWYFEQALLDLAYYHQDYRHCALQLLHFCSGTCSHLLIPHSSGKLLFLATRSLRHAGGWT